MNSPQEPQTPNKPTAFERFAALTKKVVAVPKPEIDKREAEYKKEQAGKRISSTPRQPPV